MGPARRIASGVSGFGGGGGGREESRIGVGAFGRSFSSGVSEVPRAGTVTLGREASRTGVGASGLSSASITFSIGSTGSTDSLTTGVGSSGVSSAVSSSSDDSRSGGSGGGGDIEVIMTESEMDSINSSMCTSSDGPGLGIGGGTLVGRGDGGDCVEMD